MENQKNLINKLKEYETYLKNSEEAVKEKEKNVTLKLISLYRDSLDNGTDITSNERKLREEKSQYFSNASLFRQGLDKFYELFPEIKNLD